MSITRMLESEIIKVKRSKPYRIGVKNRLKELIAEGNQEAVDMYSVLFPPWSMGEKREEPQYVSKLSKRKRETIPIMYCKTCKNKGIKKESDRVLEMQDTELRREPRKTWKRIIRRNDNLGLVRIYNKRLKVRRIFFSYKFISCLQKKHKVRIKYVNKTLKQMGFSRSDY